jgi:hypothetical protein
MNEMLYYNEQEIRALNPEWEYEILRPNVNSSLIKQNLSNLQNYPESSKAYFMGIEKLNQGKFERNLLDDLRLSVELLLKEILGNKKTLENQENELGLFLKDKNVSSEVRNMFSRLINYYSKYQNEYVKHNNKVQRQEIDLIINLTSTFIGFLLGIK